MLVQRLRRWPNIKTTLDQRLMFPFTPSAIKLNATGRLLEPANICYASTTRHRQTPWAREYMLCIHDTFLSDQSHQHQTTLCADLSHHWRHHSCYIFMMARNLSVCSWSVHLLARPDLRSVRVRPYCARLYAYGIVGKARWAHLSTSHHIKPKPLGDVLIWWRVLRSAHLAHLVRISIWNG